MTLYGIPNCNTVKKAKDWLGDHGIAYNFHDYKKQGIDAATLGTWADQVGWTVLVNKRGTTWRALPTDVQNTITTREKAIELMMANPSIIKRPVIAQQEKVMAVGFDADQYQSTFIDKTDQ